MDRYALVGILMQMQRERLILTYVEYKTVDDAKRDFKAHSIPYTDRGIKQKVAYDLYKM